MTKKSKPFCVVCEDHHSPVCKRDRSKILGYKPGIFQVFRLRKMGKKVYGFVRGPGEYGQWLMNPVSACMFLQKGYDTAKTEELLLKGKV